MSITHEQARKLIQLNMDQVLNIQESAILSAHLRSCGECQAYANEIKEVERTIASYHEKASGMLSLSPSRLLSLTEKRVSITDQVHLSDYAQSNN